MRKINGEFKMKLQKDYTAFMNELDAELKEILQFWSSNVIDDLNGGFIGEIDYDGKVNEQAEKGAVLNARILWTFSAAYNFYKKEEYLNLATRAYDYIVSKFWDKENGGLYWSLDYKGNVLNTRKQAYAQGFGIYGFSEFYKASKKEDSLQYAQKLYEILETKFKDAEFGGYIEALGEDWNELEDMRLSEKDANEPKSMNTHLHIIEPYSNLYTAWNDASLKARIHELIILFRDKIIDQKNYHFHLFFDKDWTVQSNIVSYGHDIEGAWLLTEAAHIIDDQILLSEMKPLALKMVNATILDGMDEDGGLFYEKEESHLDTDKHWWPQAESMVGLMDAYQNSKDEYYVDLVEKVWEFISSKLIDKANGEWFWKVDREGLVDKVPEKAGFWKCPYHNSRALMEIIKRIKSEMN